MTESDHVEDDARPSGDAARRLAGARVLVAVVDPVDRERVAGALRDEGADVVDVASGDAAIAELTGGDFDLATIDAGLADESGADVTSTVKSSPATATVQIIERSTDDDDRALSAALRLGADAHVVEPVRADLYVANAQALLRRRDVDRQLEVALSGPDAGVFDWSVAEGTVRWTGALERIHGMAPGEFGGTLDDFVATVHPDDRDEVGRRLHEIVEGDAPEFAIRFRFLRRDGSVGHMESRGRRFRDLAGRPARVLGLAQDVSRRVADRAQVEQLRRIGSRLSAIRTSTGVLAALDDELAGSNVGVRMVDPDRVAADAVFAQRVGEASLEVEWRAAPGGITRRQAIAIGALAVSAADRALRYEAERENARVLQRALLPSTITEVPGWSVEARYVPANATDRLGGDFYDMVDLGDRFVVTVGDVAGHGLPATRQMGAVRSLLRTVAASSDGDPATVLERARDLFDVVCGAGSPFVTVVIARFDPNDGTVELVSGGHPPALVGHADGTHSRVDVAPAPPLGIPSQRAPEVARFGLPPRSWIAMFSDGVFESREMSIDEAIDRAADSLEPSTPHPDRLIEVGESLPARTEDDRAVVVVARTARV